MFQVNSIPIREAGKEGRGEHMSNPSCSASEECHQHSVPVLLRVILFSSLSSCCLERRKESSLASTRGQKVLLAF